MLTCKSPRTVMRVAHRLAQQALPSYRCRFSRHDFTLPQLFACLVVKEHLKRSYRGVEALLLDCRHWCSDIGLKRVPDHNTLCRAANLLLRKCKVDRLLDVVARWAAAARALGLSTKPLAADSTCFEPHHLGRHLEHRRRRAGRKRNPRRALRRLPKLGVGVATANHLILSMWTGTGTGGDSPHFEPLLFDAWRRVPHRTFAAVLDAGYDSEANHRIARQDMGLRSIIPPLVGRPAAEPSTRWRRHMKRLLGSKEARRRCGYTQRWQAETVFSMIKRNLGSALSGRGARSRKRDMALKVLTHDIMILRRQRRVETEQ